MTEALEKPRGHWPAGKRRNAPRDWARLLDRLRAACSVHGAKVRIADRLGVSEKTVRRWLADVDRPTPERAKELRGVLRKIIHREK